MTLQEQRDIIHQVTLQEQRDIIQAAIDGKSLELTESGKGDWRDCKPFLFNFGHYDYRVKPGKPREFWIGSCLQAYHSEEMARNSKPIEIIHVREVIEREIK